MTFRKVLGARRIRRSYRVRNKLRLVGTKPRLCIFRSNKHIACQVIDDQQGKTVAAASTRDADLRGKFKIGSNKEAAAVIGKLIAERAKAAGVEEVCFDRGHFRYHGRVAALADAAREAGLKL